jgi:glycosyltransferase involved in cell wall biosynthesis
MDVVCFGQQNWDHCWTGKQHLMTRLAARGHRVLYVDPDLELEAPRRPASRGLAHLPGGGGLREVAPRLFVFTHRYSRLLRWRGSVWRHPRLMRAWVDRLGFREPIGLTLLPRAGEWIDVVQPAARVHYAIDEMTAYGGISEVEKPRIRAQEEALVRRSQVSLAISPRLLDRLRRIQPRTYLLPSGADVEHFTPDRLPRPEGDPVLAALRPAPIVGLVGQIDERIDQRLLTGIARARPGWAIVLVGRVKEGVDVSALERCPNVHRLGYRPFAELPRLVAGMDVCIVPYRPGPLTHSCSPLKVYEYLAAGRPVVSTPLEGLLQCADVVETADAPGGFLAGIERCLAEPERGRDRRLAVAAANSWAHRVVELERRLEEGLALSHRARPQRPRDSARLRATTR